MSHEPWLDELLVFLVAAGIIVPLFHWARVGAVLGFLLAGVAVGPFGLGQLVDEFPVLHFVAISDAEAVKPLAELGVIFLLFLLGLEISLSRLWSLRRYVFGVGTLQVAVATIAIGAVAFGAGQAAGTAMVIGLSLALSSTAIVMQLLIEERRSGTLVGRLALSVLLFQDLMVVPILFVTQILGASTNGDPIGIALALGLAIGQAALAVAVILVAGRFVLRPLFRFAARTGSRDIMLGLTLLSVVAIAVATEIAGLSLALGAFLAGLLLSESEYRHQIEVDVEPFKGLLLGLFFMTVGMSIDLQRLVDLFVWVVLATVALVVGKAAILYIAARAFGLSRAVAAETAILMAQCGEFAFVVLGLAIVTGVVDGPVAQFITVVVGITMFLTPTMARLGRWAGERLDADDHKGHALSDADAPVGGHVVIGGFGRVGQAIARVLEAEGISYVALDANAHAIAEHRKHHRPVFFGDASRAELLDRAGAETALAFIVTLDQPGLAEQMVTAIKERRPDAIILARAKDPAHAAHLARIGAVDVVPETVESSLQLGARLLHRLGVPEEAIGHRIDLQREDELGRLDIPSR